MFGSKASDDASTNGQWPLDKWLPKGRIDLRIADTQKVTILVSHSFSMPVVAVFNFVTSTA